MDVDLTQTELVILANLTRSQINEITDHYNNNEEVLKRAYESVAQYILAGQPPTPSSGAGRFTVRELVDFADTVLRANREFDPGFNAVNYEKRSSRVTGQPKMGRVVTPVIIDNTYYGVEPEPIDIENLGQLEREQIENGLASYKVFVPYIGKYKMDNATVDTKLFLSNGVRLSLVKSDAPNVALQSLKLLGVGSFGAVYDAVYQADGDSEQHPCAVKIAYHMDDLNADSLEYHYSELFGTLGIGPEIYAHFQTQINSRPCVVICMEKLENILSTSLGNLRSLPTLDNDISQAVFSYTAGRDLYKKIASIFTKCRAVHNDLKPNNVGFNVTATGAIDWKIIDYGMVVDASRLAQEDIEIKHGWIGMFPSKPMWNGDILRIDTNDTVTVNSIYVKVLAFWDAFCFLKAFLLLARYNQATAQIKSLLYSFITGFANLLHEEFARVFPKLREVYEFAPLKTAAAIQSFLTDMGVLIDPGTDDWKAAAISADDIRALAPERRLGGTKASTFNPMVNLKSASLMKLLLPLQEEQDQKTELY